ncbi:hypothetical protein E2C01_068444 [Portunus trituberculatus]|uniref:Uncharacterized protein n=1 Tax=Portunus trituberculatus TaxID=210409 RepID=A0A5B7HZG1_PORTR|nr:hypothetical protein [Portunus trituberculatus]
MRGGDRCVARGCEGEEGKYLIHLFHVLFYIHPSSFSFSFSSFSSSSSSSSSCPSDSVVVLTSSPPCPAHPHSCPDLPSFFTDH